VNATWYAQATGIAAVMEAAGAMQAGMCDTVLLAAGQAGVYAERESVAPWTRTPNEFVECWGFTTPGEMAMLARRHMHQYGITAEQVATVSATIRNHGHLNPAAIYYGRGPFTVDDILNSRMVAAPLRLLDICTVTEGGAAMVLTTVERARDLRSRPVYVLGGGMDRVGPSHTHPLIWEFSGRVGRGAADRAFAAAGLEREDVDTCEFYDPVSWEVIRQLEAYGFCGEGEGGDFVMGGRIGLEGEFPICTDGGLMSFGHPGTSQFMNKIIAGVRQLRGECGERQVPDAHVSMISNGAGAAFWNDVLLLGKVKPE
jgi:acetyl-CoA acetyltransferase